MNFDTLDLVLINILLSFGPRIEECHQKTFEYKFDLNPSDIASGKDIIGIKNDKSSAYKIFVFGAYNKTIKKFYWINNVNTFLLNEIKKNSNIFGNDKSWKKLLTKEVDIDFDEHKALPYFCAIMIEKSNLVMFEDDDLSLYAMIELNIDCKIDYENFVKQLLIYKNISNKDSTELQRNVNVKKKLLDNIKKISKKISKKIKKSPLKIGKLDIKLEGKLNKKLSKKLSRSQIKKFI